MSEYNLKGISSEIFSKTGLFSADGRRDRLSFLAVQVFIGVIRFLFMKLITIDIIMVLGISLTIYMAFTNVSKRCHEINKSNFLAYVFIGLDIVSLMGRFIIIPMPDILNLVRLLLAVAITLFLLFTKGTNGPNTYGPDSRTSLKQEVE